MRPLSRYGLELWSYPQAWLGRICFEAHMRGSRQCPGTAGHRPEASLPWHMDLSLGQFMTWQLLFFRTSQQEGSSRQKPQSFCHHRFSVCHALETGLWAQLMLQGRRLHGSRRAPFLRLPGKQCVFPCQTQLSQNCHEVTEDQWIWPVFIANEHGDLFSIQSFFLGKDHLCTLH